MSQSFGRWLVIACCAAAVGVALPGRSAAGFVFRAEASTDTLAPGGTATVTVFLDVTDVEVLVADFTARVFLGGVSGLSFTGYTDPTGNSSYLFFENSFGYGANFDAPPAAVTLFDTADPEPVLVSVFGDGTATFLIGTLTVGYSGDAAGGTITVGFDEFITELRDDAGEPVVVTSQNDTITALPADSVATPLPPAVVAFAAGGLLLAGIARRRRP